MERRDGQGGADETSTLRDDRADLTGADAARRRIRARGFDPVPPAGPITSLLQPGERLLSMERGITFDRRAPSPGGPAAAGIEGDLYLTSQRLVLVGRLTLALELAALEEAVRTSGRLLLLLRDGQGVALDVADPQLLWAEIAEARRLTRSARESGAAGPAAQPPSR